MRTRPPSVDRVNADTSGGGHAVAGAVLGGTAGDGWGRAAAYDAYADGLHTYALWYLRDHDAAADAVYCAFVAADRNHTNLQQPEQIQPWLYALLRRECRMRTAEPESPTPVSRRLRPKADVLDESSVAASLIQLEGNLRRAEFQSLSWSEAEGLTPAHREVLELTIRHGLDSRGLALVLGLREGAAGLAPTRGFGLLADAWRELERSLAAAAVAASGRENCAQLAELTFGWSGKLNATLRAPLTEHVDRCSRCQHYLHTVIGTPSAPTILPFVAAPRALRDILLGELGDLDAASDAGIDVVALGARCGVFGPEGFPARVDLSQQGPGTAAAGAGRGPRRRQPSTGRAARPQRVTPATATRPQPVYKGPGSGSAGDDGSAIGSQAPVSDMRRRPPTTQPAAATNQGTARSEAADDLFRASGSWADKVLPPDGPAAAPAGPRRDAKGAGELWRPDPGPGFVQTPSGRFATRPPQAATPPSGPPPAAPPRPAEFRAAPTTATYPAYPASHPAPVSRTATMPAVAPDNAPAMRPYAAAGPATATFPAVGPTVSETARFPRFARSADAVRPSGPPTSGRPVNPAGPTNPAKHGNRSVAAPAAPAPTAVIPVIPVTAAAPARRRHKARPMKQAVVSAMALGAIGAVAATAAAMLGVTSSPHSNTAALDGSQSSEALGSTSTDGPSSGTGAGRLSVSVTAGSPGSAAGGLLTGSTGLGVGLLPTSGATSGSAAASAPTTASAGAFYVSVNQRAADPDSVQILVRNTGGSALKWSAAPSVPWLTLSQSSGTLAAGQSLQLTATATSAAPSGQWAAQIVFSPGGIVVTLHGGIPVSTDPTTPASGGGGSTGTTSSDPSTPPTSPSTSPTSQSPTPTDSATSSQPTTGTSAPATGTSSTGTSASQPSTPTDAASGPPATAPSRPVHRR
jgi:DNA-directed RNA polymerase specialized sigma24 family protein